jgi:hypothetical protein
MAFFSHGGITTIMLLTFAFAFLLHAGIFALPTTVSLDTLGHRIVRKRPPAHDFHGKQGILLDAPLDVNPETPSATLSSIRYGPFPLPAGGMVPDELLIDVKKPCGDCFIVAMQSRLEDRNHVERLLIPGFGYTM